ncbi:MAG: DMT family transporter [Caldilineaceae bacterium]
MTRRLAVVYILITVVLWSTSGVLIKLLPWNALAISGVRSAITATVIWAYLRHPNFTWSGPQVGGAITLALTQMFFIAATQMTTAANAIFLQYSAPVFVALFGSWYLGERARPSDWLAMVAIFAGMALFLWDGLTKGGLFGSVLAMISGVTMAWMILFIRKQKDGSPAETALLGNMLGAMVGLPFAVWAIAKEPPLGAQGISIMLFMGVFQLGIPYILYVQASKVLDAVESTLLLTLEPILNPIWVFLVIGESPSYIAVMGGSIVLATVLFLAFQTARRRQPMPRVAAAG